MLLLRFYLSFDVPKNRRMNKKFFSIITLSSILLIQACKPGKEAIETPITEVNLDTVEVDSNVEEVYNPSETRVNDLLHTKLEVSFDWDSTYLYGKAYLKFKPYFYDTDSLTIDAKGFQIHELAMLNKLGNKTPLQYSYDSSYIHIDLGKTYTRNDTFEIFIDYTAMPNKLDAGGSAAITSDKGLYFINPDGSDPNKPRQIWTQGETQASSCWFPTIDSPNEKTTQEIYITVDSAFKTLSNGTLMFQTENAGGTRTDFWKQKLPHAPYLFMMAIGEFAVVEDQWRDMPVNYYVEPKYEKFAKDIYPNTPEMIEFFSNKLNYDYPWDKYHQVVVRDYVSGAMENTGAVIYGEFVQGNDRYLIDNSAEDVVAHELFHHWFGDLVTCESWANLPLNESFATYGEYLWNEFKYGKDEADYKGYNDLRVYLQTARMGKKKLIRFDYGHRMEMFDAHSYQKGGRVLHVLRNYVGDEAFFAALNHYLKKNEFKPAEIHHLRLAFEEITGEDLNWFFNQWFFSAGHPVLNVEKEYVDSTNLLKVSITQTQEGDEVPAVFKLPTSIEIVKANGLIYEKSITLDQREQTFEFTLSEAPLLVNLDANKSLLAEIKQDFSIEEAVVLYEQGGNFMDRYEAIRELKRSNDSLALLTIKKALKDSHWKIRAYAIEGIRNLAKKESEATRLQLEDIALNDEKSNVRAEAVRALNKYFGDEVSMDLLQKATDDPSYLVVSSALNALYEKDVSAGLQAAKKLEEEESASLTTAIAEMYAEDGSVKYLSFFQEKLKTVSGFNIYPLSMSFGDFLVKQEEKVIKEALPQLTDIAKGDGAWWMRMGAVNSIIKIKNKYSDKSKSLAKQVESTEDSATIADLNQQKKEADKMVDWVIGELKSLSESETNANLKRILESNLD